MADIPNQEDRLSVLTARLQNVTNFTANKYMNNLATYLESLSLDGNWNNEAFQPDTSAGVVWVIVIPILYFLIVLVILGLVIGYIWYTQNSPLTSVDQSGIASFSRTSSKRNNTTTAAGASLKDFFYDSTASQDSIVTIGSKGTPYRSEFVHRSDHECTSALGLCLAGGNGEHIIDHTRQNSILAYTLYNTPPERHHSQNQSSTPYKNNDITLTSESRSTNSYEEGLCRDSLRASMESHKLIRMGNSKIRADDTYSWSDNTTYTTGLSGKKIESKRTLHGFQNPVFSSELSQNSDNHQNHEDEFEDPLGFAADHVHGQKDNNSIEASVINISLCSAATNYPSSPNLVPYNSESSLFLAVGPAGKVGPVTQTPGSMKDQMGDNSITKVGGSLPPLPPNHYHRRDMLNSSSAVKETKFRRDANSSELLDMGLSDFDKSSLADTSVGSGTLSLPSSIAKFHASKVQPIITPKTTGFLASTQNPTPEQNTEWSLAAYFKPASPRLEDSLSICPNVGSFNQSFDESIPVGSFLDGSFEIFQDSQNVSVCSQSKDGKQDAVSNTVTPTKPTAVLEENEKARLSPLIYREGDARMKRLLSLDQLKAGRVSVEQRLRQFGYVKSRDQPKIYSELQPHELQPHVETIVDSELSVNSVTSSSGKRIENLTQEMEDQPKVWEMLTQNGKKIEARPEIDQVLDEKNKSENCLNGQNCVEIVMLGQQQQQQQQQEQQQ